MKAARLLPRAVAAAGRAATKVLKLRALRCAARSAMRKAIFQFGFSATTAKQAVKDACGVSVCLRVCVRVCASVCLCLSVRLLLPLSLSVSVCLCGGDSERGQTLVFGRATKKKNDGRVQKKMQTKEKFRGAIALFQYC